MACSRVTFPGLGLRTNRWDPMALKRLHLSNRIFHSILFCPEDEGSRFFQNIGICLPHHSIILQKTVILIVTALRLSSPGCSFLKHNSKDMCLHTFLPNFVHVIDTLNSGFYWMKAAQAMDWKKKVMWMNTPVALTQL